MDNKRNIVDYLPTKNELRLECSTILSYYNVNSTEGVLYILSSILYFCEDDKDYSEVKGFFKYLSTISEFGKEFYDKYAFIIGSKGKEIVGDIFKNNDHNRVISDFNKESIKVKIKK